MSTLSNLETGRGQAKPPSVRGTPDTIPGVRSSQTGVLVRYVATQGMNWYVFRASYSRKDEASDYIVEDSTFANISKRYARDTVNGKSRKVFPPYPLIFFSYMQRRGWQRRM